MKRITFILSIALIIAVLSHWQLSAFGQTSTPVKAPAATGSIAGKVADNHGAPLAGATVVITDTQTKESITVKTDANGDYRAEQLALGEYQVVISAAGLMTKTEKTRVKERHTANVSAHLKPPVPATPAPAKPS